MLGIVALFALACTGTTHNAAPVRLCGDSSTLNWLDLQLRQEPVDEVLDHLALGSPSTFCHPDGREEQGTLVFVLAETLTMEGDRIRARHPLTERGQQPRRDPRYKEWIVEPVGPQPLRLSLGVRTAR